MYFFRGGGGVNFLCDLFACKRSANKLSAMWSHCLQGNAVGVLYLKTYGFCSISSPTSCDSTLCCVSFLWFETCSINFVELLRYRLQSGHFRDASLLLLAEELGEAVMGLARFFRCAPSSESVERLRARIEGISGAAPDTTGVARALIGSTPCVFFKCCFIVARCTNLALHTGQMYSAGFECTFSL